MSNPLVELQDLVQPSSKKTFTAKVLLVEGQKLKVQLSTGNSFYVWGSAKINDTVLVSGKQIVAVVGKEDRPTVFVP